MPSNLRRRELLQAFCAGPMLSGGLTSMSFAAAKPSATLVVVFLRGGADSLQMLAPADDKHYVQLRPPELRVLADGDKAGLRLPLPLTDADWRLHPACAPLLDLFKSGHAQVLHASGLLNASRSHFEAQEILESSAIRALSLAPGWLAPLVSVDTKLGAVGTSNGQIRALSGAPNALNLAGELRQSVSLPWDDQGRRVLEALYSSPQTGKGAVIQDELIQVGKGALSLLETIESKLPRVDGRTQSYVPPPSAKYNSENGEWLHATQTVAQIIRMDLGLQIACLDFGGWDTHEYQGGRINSLIRQCFTNLRALFDDVSASGKNATFVVMSEFGRRLKANASQGTDHGHGGALWVLDTRARKLLPATRWPGLSIPELDQGLDLKSTADIKAVLSSLALKAGVVGEVLKR
jgi:uncharacterized protein (DUF1501 family)